MSERAHLHDQGVARGEATAVLPISAVHDGSEPVDLAQFELNASAFETTSIFPSHLSVVGSGPMRWPGKSCLAEWRIKN